MSEDQGYEMMKISLKTIVQQDGVEAAMVVVIREDDDGDLNYWHDMCSEDEDAEDLMIGMIAGHMDTLIQNKSSEITIDFECDLDEFLGEGWEDDE